MPDFETFLESLTRRPGMYVGCCSLDRVSDYLRGYDRAFADLGHTETPLHGWPEWVYLRFLVYHPAWDWARILLHAYGSDQAAIEALPQLYKEFIAQRALRGVQGIEDEIERRLVAQYGEPWFEPPTTNTTIRF